MSALYVINRDGSDIRFSQSTNPTHNAIAGIGNPNATVNLARRMAWQEFGVIPTGTGRFVGDAKTGHHNREAIKAIIRGDANAPQLARGVSLLGRANARIQQILAAPLVQHITNRLVADCSPAEAARIVADASNEHGVRADASLLGGAGAIKENLTLWMYRVFSAPDEVLHYRDVFVVDDGLDPFMLSVQLLFSLRTGEARLSDGSAGGSHAVGDRQFDEMRMDVNGLIASDTIGYLNAGRMGIMGIDALRDGREALGNAHELAFDRLAFQGNTTDGPKVIGLKNYPGVQVHASGYALSTTDAIILDQLNQVARRPTELSKEKYKTDRIKVGTKLMTRIKAVTPTAAMAKSVLQIWSETPGNPRIEEAHELDGLFGTSLSAMVGLPENPRVAPTILKSPVVYLPEVNNGVSTTMYAVSAFAGMYCESPVGITVRTFTY